MLFLLRHAADAYWEATRHWATRSNSLPCTEHIGSLLPSPPVPLLESFLHVSWRSQKKASLSPSTVASHTHTHTHIHTHTHRAVLVYLPPNFLLGRPPPFNCLWPLIQYFLTLRVWRPSHRPATQERAMCGTKRHTWQSRKANRPIRFCKRPVSFKQHRSYSMATQLNKWMTARITVHTAFKQPATKSHFIL